MDSAARTRKKVIIHARCHPALESLLPRPVLANTALPDWFRSMPAHAKSDVLGDAQVRTLKHCAPFLDALTQGILILLPCDIHVADGRLSWNWDPPTIVDAPISRSPIGVHVPEQATGTPVESADELIIKFINFWALESPHGYSLLFTHPFNRSDLPFTTLTGCVDTDGYSDGYVHFPAVLDRGFEGTIARGTPVAQVLPIKRAELELSVTAMSPGEINQSASLQHRLSQETGVYRKHYKRRAEKDSDRDA